MAWSDITNGEAGLSVRGKLNTLGALADTKAPSASPTFTGTMTAAAATFTGIDVAGLSRCDSFRIDQSPTAETIVCTHTITISINGTNYKIPAVAA